MKKFCTCFVLIFLPFSAHALTYWGTFDNPGEAYDQLEEERRYLWLRGDLDDDEKRVAERRMMRAFECAWGYSNEGRPAEESIR